MKKKTNHVQNLGERLLKLGWATKIVDTPDAFAFAWTALGRHKMKQLYRALKDLGEGTIPPRELALLRAVAILEARRQGPASRPGL